VLNPSAGRREARERTGTQAVPLLVLDDESHVAGSRAIVEWALSHPATAPR
jgi:8-oxo-dGTP pyrophosphatase MutT (NUDIX family)